jgi:hypothetical protein
VDLPKADPIPARLMAEFARSTQQVLAQLDRQAPSSVALRD